MSSSPRQKAGSTASEQGLSHPSINFPIASSPSFAEDVRKMQSDPLCSYESVQSILEDSARSPDQRFSALYYLLYRLERSHQFDKYRTLCNAYASEFRDQPYFDTFLITLRRAEGGVASLRSALTLSERALRSLGDRPGVLHQYAIIAADFLDLMAEPDRKLAGRALERIDTAISLTRIDNSNYHSTRARLLAIVGDFPTARSEIERALELEDTNSEDSLRRIARYEAINSQILLRKGAAEFSQAVLASKAELSSIRGEQMQLLGILAAVVALVVTGVVTANRIESGIVAARYSSITLGGVLAVFTGLFYFVQGARSPMRVILPLAIAFLLFAFGIWGGAIL